MWFMLFTGPINGQVIVVIVLDGRAFDHNRRSRRGRKAGAPSPGTAAAEGETLRRRRRRRLWRNRQKERGG